MTLRCLCVKVSRYGGSAWTYDEQRQQYYYHYYDRSMPDLNHRNPSVRKEFLVSSVGLEKIMLISLILGKNLMKFLWKTFGQTVFTSFMVNFVKPKYVSCYYL